MSILDGKTVLLTGGTGSFGTEFCRVALGKHKPRAIRVFSRGELLQVQMEQDFADDRLRFFIGDVRDKDRLKRAMTGCDIVVHAAALKQVPICEYNPREAVLTNVLGTMHVADAAIDSGVDRCIMISSDKAVAALNLYGATKAVGEKLWIQSNVYGHTRFSVVRYGNVIGSRGSVIPLFTQLSKQGYITLTDGRMTRFWITLEQGIELVISSLESMTGGEIYIPKIPSMLLTDLADAIAPGAERIITGTRPGEKLHEVLITEEEARHTIELDDRYVIEPERAFAFWTENFSVGNPLPAGFSYASNTNKEWLTVEQLREMVCQLES